MYCFYLVFLFSLEKKRMFVCVLCSELLLLVYLLNFKS